MDGALVEVHYWLKWRYWLVGVHYPFLCYCAGRVPLGQLRFGATLVLQCLVHLNTTPSGQLRFGATLVLPCLVHLNRNLFFHLIIFLDDRLSTNN